MMLGLALVVLLWSSVKGQEYVTVSTTEGLIRGEVEEFVGWYPEGLVQDMVCTEYEGIPYAKPPVGALRWQPPSPPDPWTGVRDALEFNRICYQRDIESYYDFPVDLNEDCLYMNIWVPGRNTDPSNLNLSVMFYVHGGAFQIGTGVNPLQFGGYMANDQNVIVVGFNYRLGPMGFFSTETSAAPGNYGLMDIIRALEWVNANIRNFGGNPNSITVYGQSAGGAAVSYLLLAPQARGLFQRAIGMSGVATMYWANSNTGYVPELSRTLATRVNCVADNSPEMVECLRGKTAEEVTEAAIAINVEMQEDRDDTQSVFAPRTDGIYVPDDPLAMFERGEFQHVDLMIGITDHESWAYRHMWYITIPGIRRWVEGGIREDDLEHLIAHWMRFLNYPENRVAVQQAVFEQYNWPLNPTLNRRERSLGYIEFLSDFQFIAHHDRFAKLYASHVNDKSIYNYYYSPLVSRDQRVIWEARVPTWIRATHADDLAFIFGKAKYTMADLVTAEERDLSDEMMRAWANFAKTGNPGAINDVTWPQYTQSTPSVLEITTPMDDINVINNFLTERMAFWQDHVWPVLDQPRSPQNITT